MLLNDLKELERFLKICRKQGITEISFDGVAVKFGDLPLKPSAHEEETEIPSDGLTPEQLMFYAVQDVQ